MPMLPSQCLSKAGYPSAPSSSKRHDTLMLRGPQTVLAVGKESRERAQERESRGALHAFDLFCVFSGTALGARAQPQGYILMCCEAACSGPPASAPVQTAFSVHGDAPLKLSHGRGFCCQPDTVRAHAQLDAIYWQRNLRSRGPGSVPLGAGWGLGLRRPGGRCRRRAACRPGNWMEIAPVAARPVGVDGGANSGS
jgi:hypothetical protein